MYTTDGEVLIHENYRTSNMNSVRSHRQKTTYWNSSFQIDPSLLIHSPLEFSREFPPQPTGFHISMPFTGNCIYLQEFTVVHPWMTSTLLFPVLNSSWSCPVVSSCRLTVQTRMPAGALPDAVACELFLSARCHSSSGLLLVLLL